MDKDNIWLSFVNRGLTGIFFDFLAACPLEVSLDRFTQILTNIIRNIIQLKKVNELELAKIDEDLLKKIFESSNYNTFDNYYRLLLIE